MSDAVQNPQGFTPELMTVCQGTCGDFGEPPCWELPSLVDPCELITPCAECLASIPMTPVYFSDDPRAYGWTFTAANGQTWDTAEQAIAAYEEAMT